MKAMLIYNPAAGQRDVEPELRKAVQYLEGRGWEVLWRRTHGAGDATTYGREAATMGLDVAIAAGGDGTIGQIVNGLVGSKTTLGVIPTGTTNVWAKEARIPIWTPLRPQAIQEAAVILAEGQPRTVDIGKVNGQYFLMWVGIGFDAQVTARVEAQPQHKRRLGKIAFFVAVFVQTLNLTGVRSYITVDGKKISGRIFLAVASNIHLYADIIRLAPMASMNDGRLDFCVFKAYSGLAALRLLVSLFLGIHTRDPEVKMLQARRISVQTSKPLPVHADGDIIGTTPVEISIVPNALRIIVPHDLARRPRRAPRLPIRERVVPPGERYPTIWERFIQ